ncbi:endonuclease domain-containing protein [Methylobacterium nodulans]|uniref:DUF559 domain-containing protein n=1 Tax=Methylobacterium nodulans (strain LMG 21967 / CNCM I-2342 / ORS 2060) TaxID=460265 RepID=B8IN62_METNO|nr:DUF559 domain-containing protein [Methylobacterium nodulans]ACL62178.1 protein of unknown function DUF559 [Methylobacterium nodulans ORS 2060]
MRGPAPSRTRRARSLRQSQTEAEARLWSRLCGSRQRDRRLGGFKFVRQCPVGPYVADFACREERLIIGADGSRHADSAHDQTRDARLSALGYRVLRFWNGEIFANLPGVLDTILAALSSPRLRGEGLAPLVGGETSPNGPQVRREGEGASQDKTRPGPLPPCTTAGPDPVPPPHPRAEPAVRARFTPDEGGEALSPQAGRGGDAHR